MTRTIRGLMAAASMLVLAAVFHPSGAEAQPNFFRARGCTSCHTAPEGSPAIEVSCNGCHKHGPSGLKGVTNKVAYEPGETVSVTITGGGKRGWMRVLLLDQGGNELARSTGNQSGKGSSTMLPAVLTAPAPATPGTYTWKVAWFGNFNNGGTAHGQVAVSMKPFKVAGPGEVPGSAKLNVSTLSDGAVTNQRVLNIQGTITGGDAGTKVTVNRKAVKPETDGTFNVAVKLHKGANEITVAASDKLGSSISDVRTVTYDPTAPAILLATPADNSRTAASFLDVTGTVSETAAVTVAVNGESPAYATMSGTAFTAPVYLAAGANLISIVATDTAGNTSNAKRTVIYDNVNPALAVTEPAQDATSAASVLLKGTVSDEGNGKVTVTVTVGDKVFSPPVKNGTFQQRLNLPAGTNEILVAAQDLAGNKTTVVRTLIVQDQGA